MAVDLDVQDGLDGANVNVNETPGNPYVFESAASPSSITDGAINAKLNAANVLVQTGAGTGANGDITFGGAAAIVFDAGATSNNLSFAAHGSVFVNRATSYTNGSGQLSLAAGSGSVTIAQALSSTGNIELSATGAATGDITVSSSITKLGTAECTLTLDANRHIIFDGGTVLVDGGGSDKYNVVLNSNSNDGGGAIQLNSGTSINSNGGTITLGGGSVAGPAVGTATINTGIALNNADLNSAGGAIKLSGKGFATGSARGIEISNGSQITAAAGTIEITGTGDASTGGDNYGVAIGSGGNVQIQTTGTGTINITGTGGAGAGNDDHGVIIGGLGTAVSAVDGAITITGTAGAGGGVGQGIRITQSASVTSTGSATISLTGTGAGSGAGSEGIALNVDSIGNNFSPAGTVTIGGASATGAISLTSLSGNIALGNGTANANVQTTGTVSMNAGGGAITVAAGSSISGTAGVQLTAGSAMTLGGTVTTGAGIQTSSGALTIAAAVSAGTGNVSLFANTSGLLFTNQSSIGSTSGNISTRFDDYDLQTGSILTAAANREVNLRVATGAVGIDLGSTGTGASFSQAEIDTVTAGQLRFTSAANITFSNVITLNPAKVATLVLEAVGGIVDGTAGEQTDISATNFALKTNTGIGAADDLDTAVSVLAFRNVTSGNVNISNTGALTIGSVFDVTTSTNLGGGTTTITASSPLTFAVNTTSAGDATYTAGETNDAPTGADDLTINTGVTVSVTAGTLTLRAGDDVVVNGNATASGTVTVTAAFNDLDGLGGVANNGLIQSTGADVDVDATGNISAGRVSASTTASLTSTVGAITDSNTTGADITASSVSLIAATGIGTSADAIDTNVASLSASSTSGGIYINETDGIDVTGVTGTAGNFSLTAGGAVTVSGLVTTATGFTLSTAAAATINAGTVAGAGGFTQNGAGTTTVNGAQTYSGVTNINAGILAVASSNALGDGSATNTLNFGGGILRADGTITSPSTRSVTLTSDGTINTNANTVTIQGNVSGAGGLIKAGAGVLELQGTNTYGGTTTIDAGTLRVANGSAIPDSATGAVVLANFAGATLELGSSETIGSLSGGGAAGGTVQLNANTLTTGGNNTDTAFAGVIAGTGGLIKEGTTGIFTLSGNNTYDGSTQINVGTVVAANNGALGSTLAGANVANGANLTLNGAITVGDSVTLNGGAALTGVGTPTLGGSVTLNASSTITAGETDTFTISGAIGGAAGTGITKAGTGTLVLTNANAYSGATTINAGTLLVNGSIAGSTTTVNNTGTLGGSNGTVGAVTIAGGGTLAPGASAGTLTAAGAVSFVDSTSIFKVEIGGTTAGTDYDQLVAAGAVSLNNATLNGSLLSNPVVGAIYTIINATGGLSGTFDGLADGDTAHIGSRAFQIDYSANSVALSLGALTISGSDPVNVLADVDTTTVNDFNTTTNTQSVAKTQVFNDDVTAAVNAGVTVNGHGLVVASQKAGGKVEFVNDGSISVDEPAALSATDPALNLNGNGGGVHYSGSGSLTSNSTGPGLLLGNSGTAGNINLIEVGGTISGGNAITTFGNDTTIVVVSGTVIGTGGTAIVFDPASFSNVVDLKPTAVVNGDLIGSGNDDAVRLSGVSGSATFDLDTMIGFSTLRKAEGSTWTVTGTFSDPNAATIVVNGALVVNGTIGGGVIIGTGFSEPLPVPPALLGGTGTVGNLLAQSGGVIDPGATGASAGTLTITRNLTMTGGSILTIEIGGAGAGQFDVLNVNGTAPDTGAIELGAATLTGSLFGGFTPTLGQSFEIIDNAGSDAILSPFNGLSEGAGVSFAGQTFTVSYVGGDGNDVTLTAAANGAPGLTDFGPTVNIEQAGPGATPQILDPDVTLTDVESNFNTGTLVVGSLLAEDTVSVLSIGFDPGEFFIDEQGATDDLYFEGVLIGTIAGGVGAPLTVTFNGSANTHAVDALIQNLTFLDSAADPTFTRNLTLTVTDGDGASTGPKPLTVHVFNGEIEFGTGGDDSFAPTGNAHIDASSGIDTITLDFRLVDADVRYQGNQVIIDAPGRHLVLSGFEVFNFTDGTVNNNDGDWLVDDLFYYSQYHDVWTAHAEADAHYHTFGWHEGRDPDAFFSTMIYLSANPDVKAAGVDPLSHFHGAGWQEGRVPSLDFDPRQYLAANPDVKAAGVDPLAHFLQFGAGEGRQPFEPTELVTANGFDFVWYLDHNPDVAAAGVDPFQHFQQFGWHEGRNPNALFDTNGYLANYGDVAAAGVNPLDHYNAFGWHEGRDPSVGFDTTSYLAAYSDVNAAHVNPLVHFLQYGTHEGRSPFADGVWG